jgi:hypothetical protein
MNVVGNDRLFMLEQQVKAVETHRHALEALVLALLESAPITLDALDRALWRLRRDLPMDAAKEAETRVRYLIDAAAGGDSGCKAPFDQPSAFLEWAD